MSESSLSFAGVMLAAIQGAAKDLPVLASDAMPIPWTIGMTIGTERVCTTLIRIKDRRFADAGELQALRHFFGFATDDEMHRWIGSNIRTPASRAGIALKCWQLGQALQASQDPTP